MKNIWNWRTLYPCSSGGLATLVHTIISSDNKTNFDLPLGILQVAQPAMKPLVLIFFFSLKFDLALTQTV